jgi:hypothetical protein
LERRETRHRGPFKARLCCVACPGQLARPSRGVSGSIGWRARLQTAGCGQGDDGDDQHPSSGTPPCLPPILKHDTTRQLVSNCTKSFPNCHITLTQTATAGETTAPSNQTLSPPLVRAPAEAPASVFAEHAPPIPVLQFWKQARCRSSQWARTTPVVFSTTRRLVCSKSSTPLQPPPWPWPKTKTRSVPHSSSS